MTDDDDDVTLGEDVTALFRTRRLPATFDLTGQHTDNAAPVWVRRVPAEGEDQ